MSRSRLPLLLLQVVVLLNHASAELRLSSTLIRPPDAPVRRSAFAENALASRPRQVPHGLTTHPTAAQFRAEEQLLIREIGYLAKAPRDYPLGSTLDLPGPKPGSPEAAQTAAGLSDVKATVEIPFGSAPGEAVANRRRHLQPRRGPAFQVSNLNRNYAVTSEGAVSVGISMLAHLLYPTAETFPRVIVAPLRSWIGADGANLMQIYFAVVINHFVFGRRTVVVGTESQLDRVRAYLRLANPYEFPNRANYPPDVMARLRREAYFLADRIPAPGGSIRLDMESLVDFKPYGGEDPGNTTSLSFGQITLRRMPDSRIGLADRGRLFDGGPGILHVLEDEGLREFDIEVEALPPVTIPDLGATFLGTSNAMDTAGLPTSHIVWAGRRHFLFDLAASTRGAMTVLGLTPESITDIVVTHLHEDHVAGALAYFHWHEAYFKQHHPGLEVPPIRLWMEPGIYDLFKKQMDLLLDRPFEQRFEIAFHPLSFYQTVRIPEDHLQLETVPGFHGTPSIMVRLSYRGRTIGLSGDTAFDPHQFARLVAGDVDPDIRSDMETALGSSAAIERVMDEGRASELSNWLFAANAEGRFPELIIHEAGTSAPVHANRTNHTSPYSLAQRSLADLERLVVNHTPDLPNGDFPFTVAVPFSTLDLSDRLSDGAPASPNVLPVAPATSVTESHEGGWLQRMARAFSALVATLVNQPMSIDRAKPWRASA